MTTIDKTSPDSSQEIAHTPHNRWRIAANFLAMSATSAIGLLVGVFISVYVRRALGPVAIGQISWNLAVLSYLSLIANPGLQTVGQREIAKHPAEAEPLTSLILTMQMLFSLVAYGLALAIAVLNLRGSQVSSLLVIQGISLFLAACNVQWVLQARERMVAPAVAGLVFNVLQFPALIVLVHSPDDVFLYVICSMFFSMPGIVYNFWYIRRRGLLRLNQLQLTLAGAMKTLAESWPLALSQGAILIYYNCDAIILGFTNGDEAVGLYTTAYKLMLVATVISTAMWNAYFPVLARVYGTPSQTVRVSSEFIALLAWMGLPITALGWAFGRHVVSLMYGPEFHDSGLYFEWLCLNIALIFVNIGIGSPLVAWGLQKLHFKITGIGALANLAVNLVVIPIYGAWGAIIMTIGAELVVLVLTIFVRKRAGILWHPMLPIVLPPLVCSAVVALGIAMLPAALAQYWWLELAFGIIILGGCLFVFEGRILTAASKLLRKA